jgi:hypothetical protein
MSFQDVQQVLEAEQKCVKCLNYFHCPAPVRGLYEKQMHGIIESYSNKELSRSDTLDALRQLARSITHSHQSQMMDQSPSFDSETDDSDRGNCLGCLRSMFVHAKNMHSLSLPSE